MSHTVQFFAALLGVFVFTVVFGMAWDRYNRDVKYRRLREEERGS